MQASPELSRAGAILRIDLDALCANWQDLRARLAPGARCAAVLKADAYGLGAHQVAPAHHPHIAAAHEADVAAPGRNLAVETDFACFTQLPVAGRCQ